MKRLITLCTLVAWLLPADCQTVLSLDSCRAMALRNNKQLTAKKLAQDVAKYNRRAMRTKYLPKVDALGTYQYFSKEISLLSASQKTAISNVGTTALSSVETGITQSLSPYLTPEQLQTVGQVVEKYGEPLASQGNALGQEVVDAFHTDTHNIWGGAVIVKQPVFMGGAIVAANKMASILETMARDRYEGDLQSTLYRTDEIYWMVVSLKRKQALAESYTALVRKFDEDVKKIIKQGLATKSQGLKVDVKVNEAEMALLKVNNGLSLVKMLLCQQCGLPVDTDITLEDEKTESIKIDFDSTEGLDSVRAQNNRSEIKLLEGAVALTKQAKNLALAGSLPQIALTGGYLFTNPNVFNGFQKKFGGVWNVGVELRIPVWNWLEGVHKVRAAKTATSIAMCQLNDAREKIDLQVAQSRYKVSEAQKRLAMAEKNMESADENLRCANIGFKEGVMETTDVMQAQTAWQSAQSARIDAEIDVIMAQLNLKKALGILQ